jgi:hypothetical protein
MPPKTVTASQAFEAEARRIAAFYNYDIEVLTFEKDRYAFGSFTTTYGAADRFRLLNRAWSIAHEHQRSHRTAEAA